MTQLEQELRDELISFMSSTKEHRKFTDEIIIELKENVKKLTELSNSFTNSCHDVNNRLDQVETVLRAPRKRMGITGWATVIGVVLTILTTTGLGLRYYINSEARQQAIAVADEVKTEVENINKSLIAHELASKQRADRDHDKDNKENKDK